MSLDFKTIRIQAGDRRRDSTRVSPSPAPAVTPGPLQVMRGSRTLRVFVPLLGTHPTPTVSLGRAAEGPANLFCGSCPWPRPQDTRTEEPGGQTDISTAPRMSSREQGPSRGKQMDGLHFQPDTGTLPVASSRNHRARRERPRGSGETM